MSRLVVPLDSPRAGAPVVGGKGAGLAAMLRAGLPVPPGFVVATAAYRAFVDAQGLGERLAELGRLRRGAASEDLAAASRAVAELFAAAEVPAAVAAAIRAAAAPFPVAVRSSATAEDLPDASFAGQYASFLNVRGEAELLAAVKRCWASLWTPGALSYCAQRGFEPAGVSVAVVVQRMVDAEAAGVLYTVNPVDGAADEIVVNAAWGLGQLVADGAVTPDTAVLDKAGGGIRRGSVGDKRVMAVPAEEGTAVVPAAADRRRRPVLDATLAAELARLGRAVEDLFGAPQDVEWALTGGRVYLLQARPVTALPAAAAGATERGAAPDDDWPALGERPPQPFDLWTQANVGEVWPQPVSPLVWSGLPLVLGDAIRHSLRGLDARFLEASQWTGRFYGRVYYNEGALAHLLSHALGLPGSFVDAALGSGRSGDARREGGLRPLRLLSRAPFLLRKAVNQLGTGRDLEALFPQIDHWAAEFAGRDLEPLADRELWQELMVWAERWTRALALQFEMSNIAMTSFALLDRLATRWLGGERLTHDLVAGLSGVYTAEMGLAVWRMARALRQRGLADLVLDGPPAAALARLRATAAARPVAEMLEAFLARFGHRCASEGEWLYPRWAEAPEQVVDIIAGYLRAGERVDLEATERRQRRRRREAVARAEERLGAVRRPVFRLVLKRAQHAVRLRDNGKHYYMKACFPMRRIGAHFGERWSRRGWLRAPADVFFLTIPDLERVVAGGDPAAAGLDLEALVAARRRAWERWFEVEAPEVVGPGGRAVAAAPPAPRGGVSLRGIPASGGRARGTARIVLDPHEAARLQPGDILVTRATDPGWTLVFPLLSGLVLEVGGQLSHAAIVAREYGLPAVVSVPGATRRLRDGETITVDGSRGRVYAEAAAGAAALPV